MVPGAGLEPARCYQRGILNLSSVIFFYKKQCVIMLIIYYNRNYNK